MKRSVFVFLFSVLAAGYCMAQADNLLVQGVSPNLYLVHAVAPKENWYSIGRLYNISPKELAPYNGLTIDKPLAIGQTLKVPLVAANFSQDGVKNADEVFVPVWHVVQEKEWMYRLSVNYNKVPIAYLEKWNGISGAQLRPGMRVAVGYLKVKSNQSALAAKGVNKLTTVAPPPGMTDADPNKEEKKTTVTEVKKTEPVAEKPAAPVVVKNDPPKEQPKPVLATATPVMTPAPSLDNKGGYFKSMFSNGSKTLTGGAGIFKSTSGWNDGKYYALMNNVGVGSIVKVSNTVNGKAIYAKVLGSLPDMKESAGLTIRISDAAAAELGASGAKFGVEIKY